MWYSCTIALNAQFDDEESVNSTDLGGDLRLEKIPSWVKGDEALKLLSWTDREHILDATWCISTSYEADSLGSPDPQWPGSEPRGIQDSIDEKFSLLSTALWLIKPSCLTCGPALHFGHSGEPESLRRYASLRPILITEDENNNQLSSSELSKAKSIYEAISLLRRDSTCWISIRMLIRALTETMWEARYLWQWIVLEALFGPDGPTETTHRLSQRIALFLTKEPETRAEIFKAVKDAYGWRSKLVHGGRLSKLSPEKSQELTTFTENTIRLSFDAILSDNHLAELFNTKKRDRYLDSLAFGNAQTEA